MPPGPSLLPRPRPPRVRPRARVRPRPSRLPGILLRRERERRICLLLSRSVTSRVRSRVREARERNRHHWRRSTGGRRAMGGRRRRRGQGTQCLLNQRRMRICWPSRTRGTRRRCRPWWWCRWSLSPCRRRPRCARERPRRRRPSRRPTPRTCWRVVWRRVPWPEKARTSRERSRASKRRVPTLRSRKRCKLPRLRSTRGLRNMRWWLGR
mmetsp:Transcript_25208/g.57539  ORF Transcript_25208/g.57539 Transcript_25208/m.57539 type:complete len:210 (+) Transcript_25208:391-1020(+)